MSEEMVKMIEGMVLNLEQIKTEVSVLAEGTTPKMKNHSDVVRVQKLVDIIHKSYVDDLAAARQLKLEVVVESVSQAHGVTEEKGESDMTLEEQLVGKTSRQQAAIRRAHEMDLKRQVRKEQKEVKSDWKTCEACKQRYQGRACMNPNCGKVETLREHVVHCANTRCKCTKLTTERAQWWCGHKDCKVEWLARHPKKAES